MTRSSTLLEDVATATTQCYSKAVPARKWLSYIHQIYRRHQTSSEVDTEDAVANVVVPYILSNESPSPQLLAYLREALVGSFPNMVGSSDDDSAAVATAESVIRAMLSVSLRDMTPLRSPNCEMACGIQAICEILLSASKTSKSDIPGVEAMDGYLQVCGVNFDSETPVQILGALKLLLTTSLLLACGIASHASSFDSSTEAVMQSLLAGPVLRAVQLASKMVVNSNDAPDGTRKRAAPNESDLLGSYQSDISDTAKEAYEVLGRLNDRSQGVAVQPIVMPITTIVAELHAALSDLAKSLELPFLSDTERNIPNLLKDKKSPLPYAESLGKYTSQFRWDRRHSSRTEDFTWHSSSSPEIVILLRVLTCRELTFATKVDVTEALLRARLLMDTESVSPRVQVLISEFYYSLMAASTETCALITSSTTMEQSIHSAACSVAWSVLCGLVPAIIDTVHRRLQPTSETPTGAGAVSTALRCLYVSHADDLKKCEAVGLSTSKAEDEDDGMEMDLFTTDDSSNRHPLRAYLLRAYVERNLVPHGLLEGVPGQTDVREDTMMLDTTLRSDAEMHGATNVNKNSSNEDILQSFLGTKMRENDLGDVLERCVSDYGAQRSIASQIAKLLPVIDNSSEQDIDTLTRICKVLNSNSVLNDVILLYVSTAELFGPMAQLLDRSDLGTLAEDDPSILGSVVLFLQAAQFRYKLPISTFTVDPWSSTFFPAYVRSSSNVTPLAHQPPSEVALVSRWISALFDSEGISDDLIRASTPQSLLILAPILVSQSLEATARGLLDLDTLKSGLTYFCNPILSFTLPGVVRLLLCSLRSGRQTLVGIVQPPHEGAGQQGVLQANLDSTYLSYVLEVLAMLLASESCPAFVHSLVLSEGFNPVSNLGTPATSSSSGGSDAIAPLEALARILPLSEQGIADVKSLRAKMVSGDVGGPASGQIGSMGALVDTYDTAMQSQYANSCPSLFAPQLEKLLQPSIPSTALPALVSSLATEVSDSSPVLSQSVMAGASNGNSHERVLSGQMQNRKPTPLPADLSNEGRSVTDGTLSPLAAAAYLGFSILIRTLQPSEGLPWDVLGCFINYADPSLGALTPLNGDGALQPAALKAAAHLSSIIRLAMQLGLPKTQPRSSTADNETDASDTSSRGRKEVAAILALRLARLHAHAQANAAPSAPPVPLPLVAQALLASEAGPNDIGGANDEDPEKTDISEADKVETPAELLHALKVVFAHVLDSEAS